MRKLATALLSLLISAFLVAGTVVDSAVAQDKAGKASVKMTVLLGFTVAAYNLDRIRSFRAKHNLENDGSPSPVSNPPNRRSKRRVATWVDIIEKRSQAPPT